MTTRESVEYCLHPVDLKHRFPLGSIVTYQDKEWTVVGYREATPSTMFASFPSIIIEREDDK